MSTLYSVTFSRSGRTIACDGETFVLTAATAAGLTLPFKCARGVCGTCKSDLVSGEVDMQAAGGDTAAGGGGGGRY